MFVNVIFDYPMVTGMLNLTATSLTQSALPVSVRQRR